MHKMNSKLVNFWYKKLKDSGFDDIEYGNGLDKGSKPQSTQDYDATINYFSKAQDFLREYKFDNPIDKAIWELHCEGTSTRKMATELKVNPGTLYIKLKCLISVFKEWVKND